MTTVRRSLAFSFMERYLVTALQLASYVLIARLLTPDEIGLYSVALALIGLAQVMREFGIGRFLIQEKNLRESHIRTAFGLSLIIGAALFLLIISAAPLVSRFYDDDRLTEIIRLIAVNFLILPFCSISMSLLSRDMKFDRLMLVNVTATVVGTALTLGLAWQGVGTRSLVWGVIGTNIVTAFGGWLARSGRRLYLPALSEWRSVLSFGGQTTFAAVVTSIATDMNDLVVGKVMGFAPVAMLSRAQGLVNLFNRDFMAAVRGVALPSFARAYREGLDVESRYVASVTTITAICWPFYGFVALHAREILRIMFGPQWDAAAPLVPILCLAAAISSTCNIALTLAVAVGRNDLAVKTDLLLQPIRAALLALTAVVFQSLEAMVWATLFVSAATTPYFLHIKNTFLQTDAKAMLRGLYASAKLALASLAIPAAISLFMTLNGYGSSIPLTLASGGICMAAWVGAIFWLRHPLSADPLVIRAKTFLLHSMIPIFPHQTHAPAPKTGSREQD